VGGGVVTGHVPKPPTDTLTGAWVIESAVKGPTETVPLGSRGMSPMRTWKLRVRHRATDVVETVQCRAIPRTEYRVGQEIEGRIVADAYGVWFRRDRAVVSRRER
jgi:hypothetical protein